MVKSKRNWDSKNPIMGENWEGKALTAAMKKFQNATNKNAVWKGKVTGHFEFWWYKENHPEEFITTGKKGRPAGKKKPTQEQIVAAYKTEFNIKKKVNTQTSKFKDFKKTYRQ